VTTLQESETKRKKESRKNTDEIKMLKDLIPKALDQEKAATEGRLKDLSQELKSLKTLVSNRVAAPTPTHRPAGSQGNVAGLNGSGNAPSPALHPVQAAASSPAASSATTPQVEPEVNPVDAATSSGIPTPSSTPAPATTSASTSFPRFGKGKGANIPEWQRPKTNGASEKNTSASGSVEDASASS
jgi:peroxin-14